MKEIKIFARAGQGAITTAKILGEALFYQGLYAYAFPHFGAARMGAPMNAFLRFDKKPIRLRSQVYSPDYIIVIDPSLIASQNVFEGMKEGGCAILAIREKTKILTPPQNIQVITLPAESIATEIIGKPFSNTVLLGAFAKATGEVELNSILEIVKTKFSGKPGIMEKNLEAVK